jgi:hypothetical protein
MNSTKNAHRNRFVITAVILATFFLIMMGIGGAILGDGNTPSIEQEWKEILLLVLGAFLGSYSRVVDFWFNGNDTNIDGKPDYTPPAEPCDCDEPSDELDNLY